MADPSLEDDLAETLEHTLVPIKPTDEFRTHLRSGLQLASQQHAAHRSYRRRRRRLSWQNWWLAVVAFSASVAAGSVLAYVVRSRLLHPAGLVQKQTG